MTSGKRVGAWILILLLLCIWGNAQTHRSDFDGNGTVDFADFLLFARAFGGRDAQFDLNGNSTVDFADFLLFAADFSRDAPEQQAPEWVTVEPTNAAPITRFDHTLILDPVRNLLVVFGGKITDPIGDTWIFDLDSRSWREIQTTPSPEARRGHAAIYDPPRRRMVIFGGEETDGFFNDVWAFDLVTERWTELSVSGDQPDPRYGTSAVFDGARNHMVMSHGFSSQGRFDDTWAFDLVRNRWTNLTPSSEPKPLKRCLHDAVYDETSDRMLLFGGCSSGVGPCPQGDLWAFDLTDRRWTQLQPPGDTPAARGNLRLNYDSDGKRMLMFGGGASGAANDMWIFDVVNQVWGALALEGTIPPARWSHDAVIDAEQGRLLIFGGTNGAVRFNDLWALNF